ncbi:MAG: membrane protein insertase YidC [Gammaproteobacteria bacterium]|nr:membrane protein insertase YidC [Gammaproteobacteria bacterium]
MLKLSAQAVLEIVLAFSLLAVFSIPAYADFKLKLKNFSISVEESGRILAASNVEFATDATADKIHLVELRTSESRPLILVEQTRYTDDSDKPTIESTFLRADGLQIRRLISTDPGDEFLLLKYVLSNPSSGPIDLTGKARPRLLVGGGFSSLEDPGGGYGAWLYSFRHPFLANADRATRLDSDILTAGKQLLADEWFGWTNRYFVVAIRSLNSQWRFQQILSGTDENVLTPDSLLLELIAESQTLLPGDEIQFQLHGLLIPKKRELLNQDKIQLERLLFMNLWDWFRWLCFGIWIIIDLLFQLCGNWGVTIILLALVIRLVTIPVTRLSLRYQEKSMQQQTRIAPLIREIKETCKGLEQSKRLIKLYEDEHYDHLAPFKGLMGLFIQIPIFIALFNILGEAFELRGVDFLWITDLATSDRLFNFGLDLPYFGSYFNLLPFLMAAITVLSTWLAARHSGSTGTQTGTLFGMAGIFFVLFYSFPSALVLYWMFSNMFQMIQQMIENREAP